ncbi:MAG: bifunctional 5,10-methylenetetrahydrofolate dehydrogenase/5,10-methenyltetrahydrofolate cyclohydrolase [Candidatus Puniceispirillales bacterium]
MISDNIKIINGIKHSQNLIDSVKELVLKSEKLNKRRPSIAVILIGENSASEIYVKNKIKTAENIGIISKKIIYPSSISEKELLNKIKELNQQKDIDGILVQLPLPMHISEDKVILSIDPKKDVDGFHPINLGNLFLGINYGMIPCTPLGCIYMLKKELGSLNGLNATIVGRSNIVGKPMQSLLLKENCTTTITHSKTRNLSEFTLKADILIAAIGMTEFIDNNYVKDKATVIDVGINRKKMNDKIKILGDVNFNDVINKVNLITPVPGGVGPMTIACLMYNTVKASFLRNNHEFKEIIFDE